MKTPFDDLLGPIAGQPEKQRDGSLLEGIVRLAIWWWMFRIFMLYILPYCIYDGIRDSVRRTVFTDRVYIYEMNLGAPPVAPFIDDPQEDPKSSTPQGAIEQILARPGGEHLRNLFSSNLYAIVDSVEEAEDWLLERGYQARRINVDIDPEPGKQVTPESMQRTFLVRGRNVNGRYDYRTESVVKITVDYGDERTYGVSYKPDDENVIDFDRFERIEPTIIFPVENMYQYAEGCITYKVYYPNGHTVEVDADGRSSYEQWSDY